MDKATLRKDMINHLKAIPAETKSSLQMRITKHLFSSFIWGSAKIIGITYAQSFEWDTKLIIKAAWKQNKMIAIPKVNNQQKTLTFYNISDFNELSPGYSGIFEPNVHKDLLIIEKDTIDLLLVPGLYFDLAGYRIGFGGGYYDRYLTDFKNNTVSILSDEQLVDSILPEKHDLAVDYLITENGLIKTD